VIPAPFAYLAPHSLEEAQEALVRHGEEAKLLAGGQSLLPMMKLRLVRPTHVVDLGRIAGLGDIRAQDGGIVVGAMTTHAAVESSPLLREHLPLLSEAASLIADVQVRNRGTVGGSLAHADPAADLPAVMLALEAQLRTLGPAGPRVIAAQEFFTDPFTTALQPPEILTEIFIPGQPRRSGGVYLKFANKASHFAIVGVAARVTLDSRGRCVGAAIGITGAGPQAFRAAKAEALLVGRVLTADAISRSAQEAGEGIDYLEDVFASQEYRGHLTRVYVQRALEGAAARAGAP
jgi:carbon-monoxide dehydrogenase medium subunit